MSIDWQCLITITLNTTGRDLLERQCVGSTEHRMSGLPVLISSAGCRLCTCSNKHF